MWWSFSLQTSTIVLCLFVISCNTNVLYNCKNVEEIPDTLEVEEKTQVPFVSMTSYTQNTKSATNVSKANYGTEPFTRQFTGKKWQVGRVSRKQYEIVNMLWRKTNIFEDIENSSPVYTAEASQKVTSVPSSSPATILTSESNKLSSPVLQTSTMSFIEFYYLDENIDSSTAKSDQDQEDSSPNYMHDFKHSMLRSPLFSFHLNNAVYKKSTSIAQNEKSYEKINTPKIPKLQVNNMKFIINNLSRNNSSTSLLNMWPNLQNSFFQQTYLKNTTVPNKGSTPPTFATSTEFTQDISENDTELVITVSKNAHSSIANDKIKFFEMYDSATRPVESVVGPKPHEINANTILEEPNPYSKMLELEQVDKDFGHGPHKIRHAKKHVVNMNTNDDDQQIYTGFHEKFVTKIFSDKTTGPISNSALDKGKSKVLTEQEITSNQTGSKFVPWSNYSFTAVYVYDRYQVHCDAAAISPHWLVAAASCLSRHREHPRREDRSAFVSYCGENWWNPERITYVKYTVVHPRYHPKDPVRRHQYNIGVIQVVTSMRLSCLNWAPIAIMSHQYSPEVQGSMASAIGWGLDRYDTSYASSDLPRRPLSLYEGLIYYDSCPGNTGYRNTKRAHQEAVLNVYCLSLPPYLGEEKDPVHGGLLLVGGKLIALYLQEERRQIGEQSAQYTGIWRLVPWVVEVANEPEDMEYFL